MNEESSTKELTEKLLIDAIFVCFAGLNSISQFQSKQSTDENVRTFEDPFSAKNKPSSKLKRSKN